MLYISNQQEKTIHLLFHNKSLTELILSIIPLLYTRFVKKEIIVLMRRKSKINWHSIIQSCHSIIQSIFFTLAFVTSLLSTKYLTKI